MALGKRLISTGAAEAACLTETTDIFGDSSGVALYSLDYDASDESDDYDGSPTDVDFGVGGNINYGARFNGSSSKIELPSALSDGVTTDATCISFWFNVGAEVTSSTTNNEIMQFAGTSSLTGKIALGSTSGHMSGETFSVTSNVVGTYTYSQTNIPAGWNHAVVQWNSSDVKWDIYINAVKHTTYTVGTQAQRKFKLKFGNRSSAYYTGSLDQIRIFSKALSTDNNGVNEIATLYAETACVHTCTTDTVDLATTNLAYYKLDNSADDETTNNYDGSETSITYEFGRYGQAAVFNGSSSKITLPTGSPFNDSDTIKAVSAWVKADTLDSRVFPLSISSTSDTNDYWYIGYMGDLDFIYIATRDGSSSNQSIAYASITSDTNWHHLVVQITATEKEIYLDGVKQTITNSNSGSGTNTSWISYPSYAGTVQGAIGVLRLATPQYSSGSIDQVRIYSTALTSSQVTELYNEKQCLDTVTEPTGNLRFDEFWAGYDNSQSNRAEFKSSGQIVDFNTYSEGHAVLNQNAQTSGKYYLEIELVDTSEHDAFAVFNRSTNTVYDDSPYAGKNPVDANYGASLRKRGEITNIGNVAQSGFTDLNLGNGDIVCMAVNVDEKRIWWGRRDGLSDNEIVWSNGNPNGGYGGLEVSFVPSDVIVYHSSESSVRFSEFKVLNHADMLEPPFNFSYLDGAFTASLTENEANF